MPLGFVQEPVFAWQAACECSNTRHEFRGADQRGFACIRVPFLRVFPVRRESRRLQSSATAFLGRLKCSNHILQQCQSLAARTLLQDTSRICTAYETQRMLSPPKLEDELTELLNKVGQVGIRLCGALEHLAHWSSSYIKPVIIVVPVTFISQHANSCCSIFSLFCHHCCLSASA